MLAAVAILGKHLLGLIGVFAPIFSLGGALRRAAPPSPWARRFYAPGSRKRARVTARWARTEARRRRVSDAVADAPGVPVPEDSDRSGVDS